MLVVEGGQILDSQQETTLATTKERKIPRAQAVEDKVGVNCDDWIVTGFRLQNEVD